MTSARLRLALAATTRRHGESPRDTERMQTPQDSSRGAVLNTAYAPEPNTCISNFPYCNANSDENAIGMYAQGSNMPSAGALAQDCVRCLLSRKLFVAR